MKKQLISFLLTLAMVVTMAPTVGITAFAASDSTTIDVSDSSSGQTLPTGVTYDDATGVFTVGAGADSSAVIVTGETMTNTIVVDDGVAVTLVLSGASITVPGGSAYSPIDLLGAANVTLQLAGGTTSTMSAINTGLGFGNLAGIHVASASGISATLTIDGTGTLDAIGGEYAAGIGGNISETGGGITISGGTVTATAGDFGAGIGGGYWGAGGDITINDGTVTATGGILGAGIGGGQFGDGGTINIIDGTVSAISSDVGAGIGGGGRGAGGNITINGGTVTASCNGDKGAGIGGGEGGPGGTITFNGGTVTATGGVFGAGIGGGGSGGAGGNITINDGTVTATGGFMGTGIGGGFGGSGGIINIGLSATVMAVADGYGNAAIYAASGSGSVINAQLDSAISDFSDTYLKCGGNVLKLPAGNLDFAFSAGVDSPVSAWSDPACTAFMANIVTIPGGIRNIPLSATIDAAPTTVTTEAAFTLTVDLDGGNGPTVGGSYASGATVSIDAGTKRGYTFDSWTTSDGGSFGSTASASTTFTMPGNATTITAVWTQISGGGGGGGGGGSHTQPSNNNTIVIDQNKFTDDIAKASDNTGIIIPVTGNVNVTAQLVVKNIEDMAKKDMTLTIQTGKISYNINTSAVDTAKITDSLGITDTSKIPFYVKISNSSAVVNDSAVVIQPVEFTITAAYDGKTVKVDRFSSFVDRTFEITAEQAKQISTGVVVEPNGSLRHVPTKVTEIDGKYYAVINSLTNSTYTVIWNPVEFSDVAAHWARDTVNDMGSRLVIGGVGQGNFEPDRDITRAEFAAIVIRALGLAPGDDSSSFTDVGAGDWYCGYVETASEYGIIAGYDAATFGPNDTITREQAMTMIARAMKITGLKSEINDSELSTLLAGYTDATAASDYAKTGIAACLKTGVVTGRTGDTIAPKNYISRAEVAVIVQRLLQKSDLI